MHHQLRKIASFGFAPKMIYDIGAYRGHWTHLAKAIFPEARVHMFEAQPKLEPYIQNAVTTLSGVSYTMGLVGAENRDAVEFTIIDTEDGSTGSSIYEENTHYNRYKTTLPMRTVDTVMADLSLPAPDLVKIDVQGAEVDIIKGAGTALRSAEVVIAELSLVQYNLGAPLIADTIAALKEHDFVLYDIVDIHKRKNDTMIQIDGLFVRSGSPWREKSAWNV